MQTYSGSTVLDQAREGVRVGYGGPVDIRVARETTSGREIVLAVTGESSRRTNFDVWPVSGSHYVATRCFRWTPDRVWGTADEVRCPRHRHLDRSVEPSVTPVDARAERAVRRVLGDFRGPATIEALLAQDPDTAALRVDASRRDDVVGVAVSGVDGYSSGRAQPDCLLATRTGSKVSLWRPSAIQVAPGEGTCDAAAALSGFGQHPPH